MGNGMCSRCYKRSWEKENPKKVVSTRRKSVYGLTPEAYDSLLEKQGGKCAICKQEKPLCVDHCHATGRVRGLLCRACNFAVGTFEKLKELYDVNSYLQG
jgi:hypothetical protein